MRRTRRGRLRLAAAAGLLVAALAGLAAVLALRGGGGDARAPPGDHLLALRAGSGRVYHAAALGSTPSAIAVRGRRRVATRPRRTTCSAWTRARATSSTASRCRASPAALPSDGAAVWVASTLTGTLSRIASETGGVTQTFRLGGADASAVALGGAGLWVVGHDRPRAPQIDQATGQTVRTVTIEGRATALAVGRTAIWFADHDAGSVTEIDARSGRTVATVDVGGGPSALALAPGALWVANSLDATVSRVDPRRGAWSRRSPSAAAPRASPSPATRSGSQTRTRARSRASTRARTGSPRRSGRRDGRPRSRPAGVDLGRLGARARHTPRRHARPRLDRPVRVDRPRVPEHRRAEPVRQARVRHARHAAGAGGAPGLRLVPDLAVALPAPEERGDGLHVPATARDPLLRRPPAARARLPAGRRAAVPRSAPRARTTTRAWSEAPPAPRIRPTAASRTGSAPTMPPARSSSASRAPDPDFLYKLTPTRTPRRSRPACPNATSAPTRFPARARTASSPGTAATLASCATRTSTSGHTPRSRPATPT